MPQRYRITTPALRDLLSIREYLQGNASLETTDRIESRLLQALDLLVALPATGHRRNDVPRSEMRFYNVGPYVVVFRREPQVVILRVCHSARDLARLL